MQLTDEQCLKELLSALKTKCVYDHCETCHFIDSETGVCCFEIAPFQWENVEEKPFYKVKEDK